MTVEKTLKKEVAEQVAQNATVGLPDLNVLPKADKIAVEMIAEQVTHQNPWWRSKRYGALAAMAIAGIAGFVGYSVPEAALAELFEVGGAAVAAVLVVVDKASDIRVVRS